MTDPQTPRTIARRLRSVLDSVGIRLFVWLFGVTILAFAAYAFVNIKATSRHWEQNVHSSADRFSDMIQRSTHYAMLLNRKEDVHHTIRILAREPGVEAVRIYNKHGEIIFSADEGDIGRRVDLQGEACFSCHSGARPLEQVPVGGRMRIFERPGAGRVMGLINPIENAPECYNAACHAHPPEQSILGVLDVTMSLAGPDAHLAAVRRQAVVAAVLVASFAGLFSWVFIAVVVRRPVNRLIAGTVRVAEGDLNTEISVEGRTEIAQLASAFNEMTGDLRQARAELTRWSDRLESRLQEKTEELGRTQREVTHMEKMASLGKLSATVAHELNNPLAGILNYAKLVSRTINESTAVIPEKDELERYLHLIQKEAGRSGDTVRNLLAFARRSGAELAHQALNPILERSVMLIRHHLEMASVQLEMHELAGDDGLICDANQVQQALVALMVNAVEAMPEGGTLTVSADVTATDVRIAVADTGVGIPQEHLSRVFEPFFSSKENADGAGLGLAVVYGIVRRHDGRINVESQLGSGTRFTIVLPRKPTTRRERVTALAEAYGSDAGR